MTSKYWSISEGEKTFFFFWGGGRLADIVTREGRIEQKGRGNREKKGKNGVVGKVRGERVGGIG
jgi:hypothetical protein